MDTLRVTTIQAPNQDIVIQEISSYLAGHLGIEVEFVVDMPWQERERMLDNGDVQVAWICGLPYVRKADRGRPELELLAAPVMRGERYQDRPIYFSDVIVRRGSPYRRFEDLHGASWAYNEPHSHSGYNITLATLAALGARRGFFSQVVESGSHARSIEMVLEGSVDASAIDSTVLELAVDSDPRIGDELRVLSSLGPSPIPPFVVLKRVDEGLRKMMRDALVTMHTDEGGRQILDKARIKRMQAVGDEDYDPIRLMEREAMKVRW